jgi:hypothetical protein
MPGSCRRSRHLLTWAEGAPPRNNPTAVQMHPPPIVFGMLFVLALIASVVAGYHTARSDTGDWLRIVGFAAVASLVLSFRGSGSSASTPLIGSGGPSQSLEVIA